MIAALAITLLSSCAQTAPLTLVKNGQPNATIIVQADAPERIQQAGKDLQKYLQEITGVHLPLKTDGKDAPGITLNVGQTESAQSGDLPDQSLNPETYAIHQRGDDVYFAGNYPAPTAFAVYSFLQDQLGVRWFAPGQDWEYVPQVADKSTFAVDVKSVVSVPDTSPRVWSGHSWTEDWKNWDLRNKAVQSEKVPRRNFQNKIYQIFKPSKYGKTHPEYFPLINGKRAIPGEDSNRRWWPCMGNKDVQRITVEYIRDYFKKHPDADSFSLGMDDIYSVCDCPLCRAMDAHEDDYEHRRFSTRFYKFVNIVAKEIKKSNPDKYIGVLIYSIVKELPEGVPHIEDNVFGYVADGDVARWYLPGRKAEWENLSREWAKRIQHLSRYDYYGLGTFVPRVYPHAMDESIKFDKSLGFEGMYTEVYTFLPHTAPMIWAFAQLQWDSQKNVDSLLDDFYSKMYPSSPDLMKQYYDLLETSWNTDRPGRDGWVHRNLIRQALSISPEAVHEGMKLLNQAYEQAATPVEKRRIDVVRGGLQYASYAVLEYDLAQQLGEMSVTNEAQAKAGLEKLGEFATLVNGRAQKWQEAAQRHDLLGDSIRGLNSKNYIMDNFAPIENFAIPGILSTINWYQTNQPDQAGSIVTDVVQKLHTIPGIVTVVDQYLSAQPDKAMPVVQDLVQKLPDGSMKDSLEALRWLATAEKFGAKSLLKNGDFEDKTPNTANPQEDWDTKGAPAGWYTWSRLKSAEFVRAPGHIAGSHGVHLIADKGGHETAILLKSVPTVRAGQRYVSAVWVKLDDPELASGVKLSFRFRTKDGWSTGEGASKAASAVAMDGWQKLVLVATVPEEATSVSVQMSATRTSATFDDVQIYRMP